MAEQEIGSAVLEVSLDGSGVDIGAQKVERRIDNLADHVKASTGKAADSVSKIGAGGDKAASDVDRATQRMARSIERATAAQLAGTKGSADFYREYAKLQGLNGNYLAPYIAKLAEAEKTQTSAGMSAKAMTAALRGVPAQFTDIAVSLAGGQRPLTVFLQQGGQLKDMFGGAGNAARVLGGYIKSLISVYSIAAVAVGGLAMAYYAGSQETTRLQTALISAGNYAGKSAGQFTDLAGSVGKATGSYSAARDAAESLASSGVIAGRNIKTAMEGIVAGAKVTGKSVQDLTKDFEGIARDPIKAVTALNEQYNFLTLSVYKQISALQDQGKTQDAATLAMQTYANAVKDRAAEVKNNLGYIERGWNAIAGAAGSAKDAVLDFGRAQTDSERLDAARRRLRSATEGNGGISRAGAGRASAIARAQAEVDALERTKVENDAASAAKGAAAEAEKQRIAQQEKLKAYVTGGSRLTVAKQLEEENKAFAVATEGFKKDSKEYQDALEAHKAAVDNINKKSISSAAATIKQEEAAYASLISSLKAQTEQNRLEIAVNDSATASQKARIKLDQDLAAGKLKLTDAHKQAILTEIEALSVSEKALQQGKLSKEINEYIAQGTIARKESAAQLQIEYELYGKTNDARSIALIAIKAQTDAEKEIQSLREKGFTLADTEIQKIKDSAAARAADAQAAEGQIKALGYAQQLANDNRKFDTEYIFDARQKAAAILKIDDDMWQERIRLAGDGTAAQRKLREEYDIWYRNQLNKPALDEWRTTVSNMDDVFRKGFAGMVNGGKDTWKSFTTSVVTTFKTSVADQIYKMFAQPFVVKIVASLLGISGGSSLGRLVSNFMPTSGQGSASGSVFDGLGGVGSFKDVYTLLTKGFDGLNAGITGSIQDLGVFLSNGQGGLGDMLGGALGQYSSQIATGLAFLPTAISLIQGDIKSAAFSGAGAAIGFAIGGPAGAALGSTLGSFVGGLFGGDGPPRSYASSFGSWTSADGYVQGKATTHNGKYGAKAFLSPLSDLQEAFANQLGGYLKGMDLDSVLGTNARFNIKEDSRSRGGFTGTIDGTSFNFSSKFSKDPSKAWTAYVEAVFGKVMVQAIQASSLADGIKGLFDGMTDKTQVASMMAATNSLSESQDQLAKRFGLTLDAAGKVSSATELAGDSLIAFVNKLATTANSFDTVGEALVKSRDKLTDMIADALDGAVLPASLDAFDEILKNIDTTNAEGIEQFKDLFNLRDAYSSFIGTFEGIQDGVASAILSISTPQEQYAARQERLADAFKKLNATMPTSIEDLIAWGNAIDYSTAEGLTRAAAFPDLVKEIASLQDAAANLASTLNLVDINKFSTSVDYFRALSYVKNGISLDTLPGGLPSFDIGSSYIPYDMTANIHAGERILSAVDNKALVSAVQSGGNNTALLQELQALRAEVAALRSTSNNIAASTKQTADTLKNVSPNGDAIQMEVAT